MDEITDAEVIKSAETALIKLRDAALAEHGMSLKAIEVKSLIWLMSLNKCPRPEAHT